MGEKDYIDCMWLYSSSGSSSIHSSNFFSNGIIIMVPQTPLYLPRLLPASQQHRESGGWLILQASSLSLVFPRVTVYGGARKRSTDIGFFKQDKVQRREGYNGDLTR